MEKTDTAFANDVYSFLWSLAHRMMSTKNSFYVGSCKPLSNEKAPFLSWLRVAAKKISGAQKKWTFNASNREQAKEVLTIYLSCKCRSAFLQDAHTIFIAVEVHAMFFSFLFLTILSRCTINNIITIAVIAILHSKEKWDELASKPKHLL